ncbi:putative nuclease HARBI1 isoform X1 [Sphaerodactylus townsendi]|nr:putative nuclease HARBI1 isoform X1 [Sphaerodactylus townsendi]
MVVEEVLVPRLVKLTDPMEQIMLGFAEIGFPQCVGAVDGCHIPIQNPADSNGEYINRKKFASIVLMAICDHRGRFYAAEAGESGKSHDAYIFNGCHFTHAIDRGAFFPATPSLVVDGVAVPPLVLGDGAFPMRKWLVTSYKPVHNARERQFNRRLSRARCTIERAFGRLKARWRCLLSPLQIKLDSVSTLVGACVVLHNICETRGHRAPELEERPPPLLTEMECQQDIVVGHEGGRGYDPRADSNLEEGKEVRDALARYMCG